MGGMTTGLGEGTVVMEGLETKMMIIIDHQ